VNENSNKATVTDSNINTNLVITIICFIGLVVFSFYFANFHNGLSETNADWGTFGDYVGGILNPVIAATVLYWIVETFKLQKMELKETRKLLEVSTNGQKEQIKLAALTAHLNSVLMRINRKKF